MQSQVSRRAQLAAIHLAQKALGLTPDDACALKRSVTGVESSAAMSDAQRRRYLAHLHGLQERAGMAVPRYPTRARAQRSVDDGCDARWRKARALWHALADAGVVRVDSDEALMAYVKRQTHMEHWRFLNGYQINAVIEALKEWISRSEKQAKEPHHG